MASFLSGAECGPVNPLKQVGSRMEVDRSLHQDRLVSTPNVAGSSRQASSAQRPRTQQPFDLSSLRAHLSPTPQHSHLAQPQIPLHHGPQQGIPHPGPAQRSSSPWAQSFRPPFHSQAQGSNHGWKDEYAPQPPASKFSRASSQQSQPSPQTSPWARAHASHQGQMHHMPPNQFPSVVSPPPFVPMPPAYHPPPPPPQVLTRNPFLPHQDHVQSQHTREQAMSTAEPLDPDQEVLARTADSFLSSLKSQDGILKENPKLAQSQFMKLVNGLSDRSVVAEDAPRTSDWQDVGPGAKFVNRGDGGDWAAAFMGMGASSTSAPAQSTATQRSPQSDTERFDIYRTFGHYTPLQTAPVNDLVDHSLATSNDQVDWDAHFSDQEAIAHGLSETTHHHSRHKSVHFDDDQEEEQVGPLGPGVPSSLQQAVSHPASSRGYTSAWEEDFDDDLDQIIADSEAPEQEDSATQANVEDQDDFGNDAFMEYNAGYRAVLDQRGNGVGEVEGWEAMRTDWDQYLEDYAASEGATALRGMGLGDQVERYVFQARNPYTDFAEGIDSPTVKGVVQLEAEVQRNPTNHEAWYSLGLKQQENERDDQAILALSKAVQLRPDWRPAYLALAVSHTNEGDLSAANTVMERWIDLGLQNAEAQGVAPVEIKRGIQREVLVDRLIDMACMSPDEVDADVQIALGVLFNASEEYEKAQDCFESALSVRQGDWLLHNRLGATLANSGRSEEAIQHYNHALALHPNFVRALYNLGISYLNTHQYDRAAQSILDALRLQHADATEGYGSMQMADGRANSLKGVGSGSLWLSLRKACTHLGRPDLVAFATARDIASFPLEITAAKQMEA